MGKDGLNMKVPVKPDGSYKVELAFASRPPMPQTARQKQLLAGGIMVFIRTSSFAAGQYHEATGQFSFP